MTNDSRKDSLVSSTVRITSSWSSILRTWTFISGLVVIFCLGVAALENVLRPMLRGGRVTVTEGGAYIIELGGRRTLQWLFPASAMWASSGVTVKQGDRITFHVTGAANLAIHHLVKSAETDSAPFFNWTGPEGMTSDQTKFLRPVDHYRFPKRIAPNDSSGTLLMQVVPANRKALTRPDGEHLYPIGSGDHGTVEIRQSGTLYFALNEIPLDSTMHDYYVIPASIDPEYAHKHPLVEQERTWRGIVQHRYWNLWFDDNVGFFLVTAEIEH